MSVFTEVDKKRFKFVQERMMNLQNELLEEEHRFFQDVKRGIIVHHVTTPDGFSAGYHLEEEKPLCPICKEKNL